MTTTQPPHPAVGMREIESTGVRIFPIGLDGSIFGWAAGHDDTAQVLDLFADTGGSFISTADHYAGGRSEVMIGSWLRRRRRDDVVLSTKVGRHPDAPGLSARSIRAAVDASLTRLGTDYLDFLAFDGEHRETPLEESLEAADALLRSGKVRHLAASGHRAERVREVQELARQGAYPGFSALFVEYSLLEREAYEKDLRPAVLESGRSAFARLPLASGFLTGMFRTRDDVPTSVMFGRATEYLGRRGSRVLDALDTVAAEQGETPGRVALAWVMLQPGIAAPVVRAKDAAQLSELLGAVDVLLTRHQVALLDAASS